MDTTAAQCAVIPVYNPKGGVGKTTTTINLSAELARRGQRVLCLDLDHTAGLTGALVCPWNPPGSGLSDALVPERSRWAGDPRELIVVHGDGVHVIPTDEGMAGLVPALTLMGTGMREARLSLLLDRLAPGYDVIFLDCPPTTDIVTNSALYAGRKRRPEDVSGPIIPILADPASDQALDKLLGTLAGIGPVLDVTIEPLGLIINQYDARRGRVPRRYRAKAFERGIPVLGVVGDLTATQLAWEEGRPVASMRPDAAISAMYRGVVDLLTGAAA